MNKAHCNRCRELVPATPERRDGRVYLVKSCPSCGRTETLISGEAGRYEAKRSLDSGYDYQTCGLNCLHCRHRAHPTFIFIDVTNRCNLNCPICINNTPGMGFTFEPPAEYFDRIFDHFAADEPKPAVQLFGGEPTMRPDLLDIIRKARSYGFPTRVVTNGLKLADEGYCRDLVATKATILIAYDGSNPQVYRTLRASPRSLDLKLKALENIRRIGGAKVALMTCVSKGFNLEEMPSIIEFCHERRDYVRGVYFMPLAQTWDAADFDLKPERTTNEDIEEAVGAAYPGEHVDFLPAGCLGDIPTVMKHLHMKPPPFRGAHPNCESMYMLVSDGERYRPLGWYLKDSTHDLVRDLTALEARLAAGLRGPWKGLRARLAAYRAVTRHVRLGRLFRGRGPSKLGHALAALGGLLLRRKTRRILEAHTTVVDSLQLIVLPFEDEHVLETDRMERCPNAFAFYDPEEDAVRTVPVCAWGKHKKAVLRKVSEHYENAQARERIGTA
jgi:uncharacterized radical SAM superfamily Fe-S cluster-containing enzyme